VGEFPHGYWGTPLYHLKTRMGTANSIQEGKSFPETEKVKPIIRMGTESSSLFPVFCLLRNQALRLDKQIKPVLTRY